MPSPVNSMEIWDGDPSSATAPSSVVADVTANVGAGDSPSDAAVRALGIDPATNQWLPGYEALGQRFDPAVVAAQARASVGDTFNADFTNNQARLAALNQQSGGFVADLLNPLSPNIDPNSATAHLANSLAGIPWKTVLVLLLLIVIVAGIHEVKSL